MNRKERAVKVIAWIAFAAIIIASIFAMIAPTTMAGTNGGFSPDEEPASSIRIYGDVQPQGNAPEQYITYKEPFDPTVIPTDSITYNPAIIEESREPGELYYGIIIGKGSSGENAREKIFLRSWYEPCGQYNGPGEDDTHPTINMEYTYMLLNTLYLPITGTAPNTQFLMPTCEIDTQTGLGAWLKGTADPDLTTVASISGPAVAPSGETVLGKISLEKRLALPEGDIVQFFDHTVELTNITISGEFVIKVAYAGNAQDDSEKGGVSLEDGDTIYFDRHNNEYTIANHDAATGYIRTWYVSRDEDTLIVGKELHWSDVFYVDGVRYEVTAVEVVDTDGDDGVVDAFKYITLRTKLPKGVGSVRDESVVSSQYIDCIEPAELIPLLPPFNMNHDMVDDIDIPLWTGASEERDWTRQDYAGTELDPDGDGNWIAYDVNERVIDNIDPLELTYIAGEVEERYSTNLLEKLREDWEVGGLITESWTKFDIQSLPDQYTEFVLPVLPDYYTLPIAGDWPVALDGDYLITTSWIAPQATGDLYDNKRGAIPGDPNEQRVAFSYDPKDGEDGNDFYVYYDEEIKMGTLKIYGNGSDSTFGITNSCNIEQYENWEEPFNPTAIRTASITFDAAILQYSPEYPMTAQNENVDMKEYLRVWYVPEYEFYGWHEMTGLAPAIVIEATYMLIDSQDKKPWHADVGSWFPFPIVSDPTTDQIGLESFENAGVESVRENLVRLASLSCDPNDITEGLLPKTTNGTIRIEKTYIMEEGDVVQFIDRRLEFTGYGMSGTDPRVTLSYCGNTVDDAINANVYLTYNETFFDRHNSYPGSDTPIHPDRTWYVRYEGRLNDTDKARITVGKELQRGDVFYVDGVRYEIPAIEVLDHDGDRQNGCEMFKYITLRTPLPKYLSSSEYMLGQQYLPCADSQWLTKVEICHPLPVLPPLNWDHELVDDTDVVLWQPLKLLDKWPYGDIETGNAGTEYFPCGERYLTMQYPPAAWLEYFRAVPIDTDGDMSTSIPSDWQLWDDYGGPFYPGDVTVAVPDGWQCCECGIQMPLPDGFTVFDREHWIANDVNERIIGLVDPLQFCWKDEMPEPRYSTNLLEILDEDGIIETWTKFDIRTIPDEYTRFNLPEVESLNPEVYVGGEYQVTFEPDIRFDPLSLARPGCCLITTSFFAPNAKGDLNREHSYSVRDRFAFTFNPAEGTGIYMNKAPVIPTKLTIVSYTISNTTIKPPQTTAIDVEFSESVSYKIAIENATGTIYKWTGKNVTNPMPKVWDGTYEANGTIVPAGNYTVNVTGTNTTTGKSVTDTSKVITVLGGEEVYGVDLNVDISEQTVAPNVTATYTLTVKNTGKVADNYALFVTNENNATFLTLNKCLIANLAAGASESILLNVSNTTEGTFVVDVTVTSEKGGACLNDMITTTTTVQNVTLTIVSYTISNTTIIPPQTTKIDVAFSETVSYKIAIENATSTIYDWTGNAKNLSKVWDGTYEANGTVVPVGDYTVNVTGTNTTSGLSVVNNTEIITVTTTTLPVHNMDTGEDFSAIQAAIDAANTTDGDTITVDPGTYVENVDVTKTLTIKSTTGNPADTIVHAKKSDDHIFEVTADYVNISGFTVNGATGFKNETHRIVGTAGICLKADNCTVSNNTASNNSFGIYLYFHSSQNQISNNIVSLNDHGIYLEMWSSNNIISNNSINYNTFGIGITYSSNNKITNNNASYNGYGIYINSNNNIISNNIISNNDISRNDFWGIHLISNSNFIFNNNVNSNRRGISMGASNNNTIHLNNFTNNTLNVYSYNSTNIWNSTSPITYTYNGSNYTSYLGNYWDDYTDVDADSDGVWDSPRPIDPDMDYHPLVDSFENYVPVPPVSSIHDLNATAGTTWINWTWKNPAYGAFNHTMIYINNAFITNTSGTNYNLTNLLPGTTHTISTRTVSTDGVLCDTWLNDTVTTTGALPGGLFINVFGPETYSVYTVGDTIEFNITVMNPNGTPITDVSAYAVLSSPNDTLKHIILSNSGTNILGNYTFSKEDPRGIWMADIIAYNDTSSGHASVKIFFIRPYYIQPRTDKLTYISGETANLYAQVMNSKNLTQFLTDEDLTLNMSVYPFNETTPVIEPFEMPFNITSNEFQASIDTSLLESGVFTILFEGMDNAGNTEDTSLRIGISKDFSVVVNTDKTYYDRGDSVNISGTVTFADANPFTNANVTVCIDLRGFRRSYPTTTDGNGEFNFTFQPFTSEAGDYEVKAEVWNMGLLKADETQFTIQGLYLAPPQATFNMVENSTQTINFILYNLGDTALTGINANVEDLDISDNVNAVIIDVPDEVSPHEQIELILQINAGVPVPDKAKFILNVTTDQRSNEVSELTINLFSPEPVMVVNPGNISVGLNQNQTKIETVTVSNIGYGFLRNLTLNQPDESWMRITSNTSIGDLAPGENISFDIHIHSYNVSFGAYHDTVNITSDNYNAVQVNLMVNITELTNGSLLFHVNDYFGRNVTANISVIDDITYHEYTTTTNSTGYAFVGELPTGRYIYEVSSYNESLSSQLGSVIVEPSITKRVNVTLPISFIDFEWNVTPTTIEDWYKVVLNMTFETDVPIPIIVAFPPYLEYDLQRGEVRHDTLTLTNLGLVSLYNISITPIIDANVEFTPMVSKIEELKPKSSVQLPYTIKLSSSAPSWQRFTGRIDIKGDYVHFVNEHETRSPAGTVVPLIVRTPRDFGSISGTVTDADTGELIDGALVIADGYSNKTISGNYQLIGIPTGTYTVTASKSGYYHESKTAVVTKGTITELNFQLEPILTDPTGTITGTVTDNETGEPLAGAYVTTNGGSATTDEFGRYAIPGVPTGTNTVSASKIGFFSSSKTANVTENMETIVDFQLSRIPPVPIGTISGKVTDADTGKPIEGALVIADGYSTRTGISGNYQLIGIPAGNYTVTASKSGYYWESTTAVVTKGKTTELNFQLELIPPVPTGIITGTVTNDTRHPLAGARVTTNGGSAKTDQLGRYTIPEVPIGTNTVRASKIGYYSSSKTATVNEDEETIVDFQLSRISIPHLPPFPHPAFCLNGRGIGMTPECLDGIPSLIWIFEAPENLDSPSIFPTEINARNCNEEGDIKLSDAVSVPFKLSTDDLFKLMGLPISIGLSDILRIPIGDLWIGDFNPNEICPNEESTLDVKKEFPTGIRLPLPELKLFGGTLTFEYGPLNDFNCIWFIPMGGMEVKEGNITFTFPPMPDWPDIKPVWPPIGPFDGTREDQFRVTTETIHEIVYISVSQDVILERDAFQAGIGIRNRMPDTSINNVRVNLRISDGNGPADEEFFIKAPILTGISDVDGSGSIDPLQSAKAQWLIIPKPGAGGVSGQTYNISANITYSVDGVNFMVTTQKVEILVKPQPQLSLDYYIPSDVIANQPFKLAVKVTNAGYSTAKNFSIETAQPVIYNPSGLLVDFNIIGSALQGEEGSTSLKVNFGDVDPAETEFAWWEMVATLDGTFTKFTGSYTHSDELGGAETSLITELNTHIIMREINTSNVTYDFLVDSDTDDIPDWVINSTHGGTTEVYPVEYNVTRWPVLENPVMTVNATKVEDNWIYISVEDPFENNMSILSVVREDGKILSQSNYWMRDGRILIVDDPVAEYTITFDTTTNLCGDVAPSPDCDGTVDMGDVILLLNNVSYLENPRYVLCNDWSGDCRCTGVRDMGDVILLLNNVSYPEVSKYALDCCG